MLVIIVYLCLLITETLVAVEPSFDVPVLNVTIVAGDTAILPCSVENLGEYKVVWTDQWSTLLTFDIKRIIDDDRISVERPYTKDWNLLIHDVSYSDKGRYTCQINTTPVKAKYVELFVLVRPHILENASSKNVVAKEGETVELICNVTGVPPPTVYWSRRPLGQTIGSKELLDREGHIGPCTYNLQRFTAIGMNGEILVIHNVSRYCDGIYECMAFNDVPPAVNREMKVEVESPSAASTTPVTVRSDIACNGDSISVFVPKNLLPAGQRVTWRDQDCSVSDNGTHYIGSVDFSGCGTTVQFTNDSVQFRNELISHNNNIGNISSVIDFGSSYDTVVPVECVYPKKANTMSSYLPIHERVQFKERRMGHLRLQMQQTADATFHDTLPQQQDGSPRKVPINQNIFIKLSSTAANRSDVGIRVDNCVATPTPSPADSTFQTLVDDGCPAIGAVTRYDSPSDEARFGVRAFQFSASPASLVYVHCQVSVCPTSDPQCITSCTPASRKRRSVQSDHESHLVSSGPYLLVAEQGSAQVATIVAAVCGLLAVVATTFAVIVWKKKRPTENSCST